jgi:hypothetical protein
VRPATAPQRSAASAGVRAALLGRADAEVTAAAAVRAAATARTVRATRPLSAAAASAAASASALASAAAAAAAAAVAAAAAEGAGAGRAPPAGGAQRAACAGGDAAAGGGKHLCLMGTEEVCALLGACGWDAADLRGLRRARVTGGELLLRLAAAGPSAAQLGAGLGLPPSKAARLRRRLAPAAALFDAVAPRRAAPALSDADLAAWLAGAGVSPAAALRALRLLQRLVPRPARRGGGFTFAEWAAGWPWVVHALEVHGVPWRAALA